MGGTLYPGIDCPSLLQVTSDYMFIETSYDNCFHYPLEGISETSNNQALLIPFSINIKFKAYMRVAVGDTLPWGRFSPSTTGKY